MPERLPEPDLAPLARRALEQWDLEVRDVKLVNRSENIVFRVTAADGGVFVLRMHRPGYHSYAELVSEQLWTAALGEAGIDVPVPHPTRKGEPYGQAAVLGEIRQVGLLEWVEGETMGTLMAANADSTDAGHRFRQLGALLAAMHDQACRWQPPPTFVRPAVDADGLMGEAPGWGRFWEAAALTPAQRSRFAGYRERLHAVLARLPASRDRYSLIHADLHPYNVVVHGARLHVIDFDDAAFGWHAYDFAVALKNYQSHPDFARYTAALIEGYRELRALDATTVGLIPLFLLIRALISIGWADARPELGHPEYAAQLARGADAAAEAVLARFE